MKAATFRAPEMAVLGVKSDIHSWAGCILHSKYLKIGA